MVASPGLDEPRRIAPRRGERPARRRPRPTARGTGRWPWSPRPPTRPGSRSVPDRPTAGRGGERLQREAARDRERHDHGADLTEPERLPSHPAEHGRQPEGDEDHLAGGGERDVDGGVGEHAPAGSRRPMPRRARGRPSPSPRRGAPAPAAHRPRSARPASAARGRNHAGAHEPGRRPGRQTQRGPTGRPSRRRLRARPRPRRPGWGRTGRAGPQRPRSAPSDHARPRRPTPIHRTSLDEQRRAPTASSDPRLEGDADRDRHHRGPSTNRHRPSLGSAAPNATSKPFDQRRQRRPDATSRPRRPSENAQSITRRGAVGRGGDGRGRRAGR